LKSGEERKFFKLRLGHALKEPQVSGKRFGENKIFDKVTQQVKLVEEK